MSKKKILVYADSPTVKTGFGTVSRNILEILYKTGEYDIDIFGINYHGTPHQFPYNIWPAMDHQAGDPYGKKKFCQFAIKHDFDILWVLQDTFIVDFLPEIIEHLRINKKKPFKVVMYYPTDSIIKPYWYRNMDRVDKLVSYTEFGKEATLKAINVYNLMSADELKRWGIKSPPERNNVDDIDIIYHGINIENFHPLTEKDVKQFRKNYFNVHSDKFIFMNVNRNQQRKDIPRTIQAFKKLRETHPDTLLYLHMASVDQGWSIPELCVQFGLSLKKDVILPQNFEPNQCYPVEVLNLLYNSVDAVVSTTLGEGFGLGWVESMACGTPTIMPRNTAMEEIITQDIGYLVNSGSNDSLWTCVPNDNNIMRPLVDVDDLVKTMAYVVDNYDEAKDKAKKAYKWVTTTLDWKGDIAKQWTKIFKDLSDDLVVKNNITNKKNKNVLDAEVF